MGVRTQESRSAQGNTTVFTCLLMDVLLNIIFGIYFFFKFAFLLENEAIRERISLLVTLIGSHIIPVEHSEK